VKKLGVFLIPVREHLESKAARTSVQRGQKSGCHCAVVRECSVLCSRLLAAARCCVFVTYPTHDTHLLFLLTWDDGLHPPAHAAAC
jgi:hypothetical protein